MTVLVSPSLRGTPLAGSTKGSTSTLPPVDASCRDLRQARDALSTWLSIVASVSSSLGGKWTHLGGGLVKVVKLSDVAREPAVSILFTGDVSRQAPFEDDAMQSVKFSVVNFSASSRDEYHTHTSDRILLITEGTGAIGTDEEYQSQRRQV